MDRPRLPRGAVVAEVGWQRGLECGRGRARVRVPSLLLLRLAEVGIWIFYITGQLQEALSAGVQGVIIIIRPFWGLGFWPQRCHGGPHNYET